MSEFIAEAQVLIVPNTAAFAASLRTQIEAAVAAAGPVAIPVEAVAVSTGAVAAAQAEAAAATKVATTAAKEQVVALNADAVAHERAGVATAVDSAAQRKNAVARSQATRAVEAQAASIAGLRGAALTASTPFLAATVAVIGFGKAINLATSQQEELNKSAVVFGQSSKQIEEFARTSANSLGISEDAALKAAGVFGNLFRSIKIGEQPAADMSQRLVELSADLASFNNADPQRVLEALRSGLVGQARPLRVFGIFISQARAQQEALIETGKKNVQSLTNQELVQARYNIILRDSSLAQGDFARTSERLANQTRILKANLSDLAASIGTAVIPGVTNLAKASNDLLRIFRDIEKVGGKGVSKGFEAVGASADKSTGQLHEAEVAFARLFHPGQELEFVLGGIAGAFDRIAGTTPRATKAVSGFHFTIGGLAADLALIRAQNATQDIKSVTGQLRALEVERLKIQTGLSPGGRPAEEANLNQQIALDKKNIAQAKAGSAARKRAIEDLHSDQQDLAGLISTDSQDAQSRAQDAKAAADKAAQAQTDATQAFLDSFSGKRGRLDNRLATAAQSGTAKTQIALNKLIVSTDKAEISAIKDRITHLKLHGDALKIAKAAIQTLNQEIFNTRNAILQLQADRKQAIVDARQSHLEAQLAIAETTKSTADDRRAEKALIAFDQAQIRRLSALKKRGKATRDEIAQLDAYRVDLAQRNAALKKTTEEQKKASFGQFQFAQALQGFAANLLGNLIPGFATGGLVGGSQAAAAQDAGLRQVAGGFEQPRGAVQGQAALASSRDRGVRPVQVDTTNALLRQILRSLQNLNGRASHPEARYQNRVAGSNMDTIGGV